VSGCVRPFQAVLAVLVFGLLLPPPAMTAQSAESSSVPSISWNHSGKNVVEVSGVALESLNSLKEANWTETQWQQLFGVYVAQEHWQAEIGLPAVLGKYSIADAKVRFEPRFPFEPKLKYNAVFKPALLPKGDEKAKAISSSYEIPSRASSPSTVVSEIYPTADLLPENLLKFYLHFSAPMRRGHVYDYIQLLDEKGAPVELPFLEINEELWSEDMTRLTLFLDPGRIKRGVKPLEEVGPALQSGKSYTLVIRPGWQDATGNSLVKGFEKKFRVGPVDREAIDPARWKIQPGKSATRNSLQIDFEKPLDHALALRMIRFLDSSGKSISGQSRTEDSERRLSFTPEEPWLPGSYTIAVESIIEDLAGNNIGKPFEVDVFDKVQPRIVRDVVTLPFQIN